MDTYFTHLWLGKLQPLEGHPSHGVRYQIKRDRQDTRKRKTKANGRMKV